MSGPVLRVALPWLQSSLAAAVAAEAAPALDALRWLGGRGHWRRVGGAAWRDWLLEPVGGAAALADAPAGPAVAARQEQIVDGAATWCLAQPVHLAPGLDHVRMGALESARPTAAEAASLATTVDQHFDDGVPEVVAWIDGAWLLRFPLVIDCESRPPDAVVGHDVHDSMPSGRDGARVRSLMNEIQMLLHEHPVNLERARVRQQPINGWWLWGFGSRMRALDTAAGWSLRSDDPWLTSLWSDGTSADPGNGAAGDAPQGDTLVASSRPPSLDDVEALRLLDAGLLSWLMTLVRAGSVARVDLLIGDHALTISGAARWAFWRRPVPLARWLE